MQPRHAEPRSPLDAVYRKISRRLMPFLCLLYVMAWLDRVNVGFARLQMVDDLHFTEAVYGFGAGIFYLGYLLFEIPSNLYLERIGARKTLARITTLWGVASIATMFARSAGWFYLLRFLLGAFEAGLYPGVILYLTYWFPARRRAQMVGWFMLAIPAAGIFGSPLSGWIMGAMSGRAGLANWQWLFLAEGVPSIVIGIATLVLLDDRPADAHWLSPDERRAVLADLAREAREAGITEHGFGRALRSGQVWLLVAIYFCLVSANPTLAFWTPAIIKGFGVGSDTAIGFLSAVPYLAAMAAVVTIGRHSDRVMERRLHTAGCCAVAGAALVVVGALPGKPALAFAALVAATAAVLSAFAPFWQIPTTMLSGTAAAGGIALINSLGNLSGWLGPFAVGWLDDVTGRTSAGLYVVACLEIAAAALIVLAVPSPPVRST